jgi:hypothetical protein
MHGRASHARVAFGLWGSRAAGGAGRAEVKSLPLPLRRPRLAAAGGGGALQAGRSPRRPTPQARGGGGGGRVSGPGARSCTHTDARHPGWAEPTEADPAGERRRGRRPVSGPGARACACRLAGRSP